MGRSTGAENNDVKVSSTQAIDPPPLNRSGFRV